MIQAVFYLSDDNYSGFNVSGHSDYSTAGSDIVCASVSSAVQLAANLIEGYSSVKINERQAAVSLTVVKNNEFVQTVINHLYLHLKTIEQDYNKYIKASKEVR